MIIHIPKPYAWLQPHIVQQGTQLSNVTFQCNEKTIQALLQENCDAVVMPLQDCDFHWPLGIVISALTPRQEATYTLAVRQNQASEEGLLGIAPNHIIVVPNAFVAAQLAVFFPQNTIKIEANTSLSLKNKEITAVLFPQYYTAYLDTQSFDMHPLHPREFIPAAGQGTLAWITRTDDLNTRRQLKMIHDSATSTLTNIERRHARDWHQQQLIGAAYCEKDNNAYYHLYTAWQNQDKEIIKDSKSFSTLMVFT